MPGTLQSGLKRQPRGRWCRLDSWGNSVVLRPRFFANLEKPEMENHLRSQASRYFGGIFCSLSKRSKKKKRPKKRADFPAMIESWQVMEAFREKRFFGLAFRAARPLVPGRLSTGHGGVDWMSVKDLEMFFFHGKKKVFSDHFGAHRDCRNSFGVDNYNFRNAGGQCFGDAQPSQLSLPELAEGPYFILANLGTSRVAKMGRHCRDCVMISLWLSLLSLSLFYDILRMFRV